MKIKHPPCSTGQGFLVLQDTGPYWVAGWAFCGLGKMETAQTAVAQERTAWAGLGKGPQLPSQDHTADPEIPTCKEEKGTHHQEGSHKYHICMYIRSYYIM